MIFNPFRLAAFLAAFLPLGVYGYDLFPTLGIVLLLLVLGLIVFSVLIVGHFFFRE
jgi:hypothetical protein